jgi:hypothetical protein
MGSPFSGMLDMSMPLRISEIGASGSSCRFRLRTGASPAAPPAASVVVVIASVTGQRAVYSQLMLTILKRIPHVENIENEARERHIPPVQGSSTCLARGSAVASWAATITARNFMFAFD